jgi:hypothetical protein
MTISIDRKKTKRKIRRMEEDAKDLQVKANVLGGVISLNSNIVNLNKSDY